MASGRFDEVAIFYLGIYQNKPSTIYILGTNRILPFIFIKTNLWEPIVYCFIITLPGPNPSDTDKNESYRSQLGDKWQIPGLFYEVDYFEFLIGKFG